jgi:hypothetical protein
MKNNQKKFKINPLFCHPFPFQSDKISPNIQQKLPKRQQNAFGIAFE